jgi:hypothetical protein
MTPALPDQAYLDFADGVGANNNPLANYSTASSPHTLTFNPYDEDTLGTISASNGSTSITGTGTSFLIYSGTGASIGIGATLGSLVSTWYNINSINSDAGLYLSSSYSGSSTASTTYIIRYPNTAFSVDGYSFASTGVGQTVLVKNQSSPVHNGVYYVSTLGSSSANWILSRVSSVPTAGDNFKVLNGTKNSDSIWFLDKDTSTVTYGTTELNWKINRYKIFSTAALGSTITSVTKRNVSGSYEYLIGQFAAGSGKKAGEFYTPQQISTILSEIVTLDSQDPSLGKKKHLESYTTMQLLSL